MTTPTTTQLASTARVPPAEISGLKGTLMKRMAVRTLGKVPTALGVYWHNPKVLAATFGLGGKVQRWHACDEQLKSFAHMAVASMVGCSWCLDYNYFQAFNEHLDLDKAQEVPRWQESGAFTPLERDVLAYAEAMTHTPPTVTDEMSARLLDRLGAAALVELTSVIAFANFLEGDDGPVVMLNLLRFKPGGRELYDRYSAAVAEYLPKVGGEVVYAGDGDTALVAEDGQAWDAVILVRYQSRAGLSAMVADPAYQEVAALRTEALEEAVLQATIPWPLDQS